MKKTLAMGLGLMIGGSVLVLALAQKPSTDPVIVRASGNTPAKDVPKVLSTDIATERKILQIKAQEREQAVKKSDAQIKALLDAQEYAKQLAIQKANSDQPVTDLVVQARPEAVALSQSQVQQSANVTAPQMAQDKQATQVQLQQDKQQKEQAQKQQKEKERREKEQKEKEKEQKQKEQKKAHTVQSGDTLIRLSRQYGVPVSVLAEANGMSRNDALPRGKTLVIPSKKEAERLEQTAKQRAQSEQQKKAADERLKQARQSAKKQGVNEHYAVQVALSSNQESADRLVKKYQQAGYQARTKKDARGIRVIIPEQSKEAAQALKDKLRYDPDVDSQGAWVLQVKP